MVQLSSVSEDESGQDAEAGNAAALPMQADAARRSRSLAQTLQA
jgi:hypothetical protein